MKNEKSKDLSSNFTENNEKLNYFNGIVNDDVYTTHIEDYTVFLDKDCLSTKEAYLIKFNQIVELEEGPLKIIELNSVFDSTTTIDSDLNKPVSLLYKTDTDPTVLIIEIKSVCNTEKNLNIEIKVGNNLNLSVDDVNENCINLNITKIEHSKNSSWVRLSVEFNFDDVKTDGTLINLFNSKTATQENFYLGLRVFIDGHKYNKPQYIKYFIKNISNYNGYYGEVELIKYPLGVMRNQGVLSIRNEKYCLAMVKCYPNIEYLNSTDTLALASQAGFLSVVKELLQLGVDLNKKVQGYTPIKLAVVLDRYEIAELLISEGCRLDNIDSEGNDIFAIINKIDDLSDEMSSVFSKVIKKEL